MSCWRHVNWWYVDINIQHTNVARLHVVLVIGTGVLCFTGQLLVFVIDNQVIRMTSSVELCG